LRLRRRERLRQASRQRWRHRVRRLKRAVIAAIAIPVAAIIAAIVLGGLGERGLVLTFFATVAAFAILAIFPRTPRPKVKDLQRAALPELAGRTALWLETQRGSLPREVHPTLDLIGASLDQLSPQLALLPEQSQASREIRSMLGVHLPSLVNSYTCIPEALRDRPHAGSTPEAQLAQGLEIIAREIESVSHQIARGELDELAIRGRYLETRYVGSGGD
jgi:hypothetical protein